MKLSVLILFVISTTSLESQTTPRAVTIQFGFNPFRNDESKSWEPDASLRIGLNQQHSSLLETATFAELIHHVHGVQTTSLSNWWLRRATRQDLALYEAVTLFQTIEIALGAYCSWRDQVVKEGYTYGGPLETNLGFYYHIGAGSTFKLSNPVHVAYGIYLRSLDYGSDVSVMLNIGLRFRISPPRVP